MKARRVVFEHLWIPVMLISLYIVGRGYLLSVNHETEDAQVDAAQASISLETRNQAAMDYLRSGGEDTAPLYLADYADLRKPTTQEVTATPTSPVVYEEMYSSISSYRSKTIVDAMFRAPLSGVDVVEKRNAMRHIMLTLNDRGSSYDAHEVELIAESIIRSSRIFDVNWRVIMAVMEVESCFDKYAVSHSDARGLMQVHAPTWCRKFAITKADLHNIPFNVYAGTYILRKYLNQEGGYLPRALFRYYGTDSPKYIGLVGNALRHQYRTM